MNANKNKGEKMPSRRKAQGSTEYLIIVVFAVIVAIVVGYIITHGASNAKVGNVGSIVAAGNPSNSNTILVLALSEPLPNGVTANAILNNGATASIQSVSPTSATYVNNYPEYTFSGSSGSISPTENVTSVQYVLNGQTIDVPTSTGQPLPIQPITGNVVTP